MRKKTKKPPRKVALTYYETRKFTKKSIRLCFCGVRRS